MRFALVLLLLLLLLSMFQLSCASSGRIDELDWIEAKTPHFTIWSCMREADTRALARNLELFRRVVEFVTGEELPTASVPVHVYAFDHKWSYRPFAIKGTLGASGSSMRDNTIVMVGRRSTRIDATELIQHEFVHYLIANHADFSYPTWYHEGFAEFMSTVEYAGEKLEIGAPRRQGRPVLDRGAWIPVEQLLEIRHGDPEALNELLLATGGVPATD